jgi:SAM-dependent methyltransferase
MPTAAALRDAGLADDICDLLTHDERVCAREFTVTARGGVAHLWGRVRSDEERRLVRRLVGSVRGVHAVWDVLQVPGEPAPRVIDIGCGNKKQRSWALGVDRQPLPSVGLVADLEAGLPLADNSVDQVYAVHVLEHVHNLIALLNAIHRVLKPTGVLHVLVPNWGFVNAVADPTHVRFFSSQTFKAFCRDGPGIRVFLPLVVTTTPDTIYADLQPVKDGGPPPSEKHLLRFFT